MEEYLKIIGMAILQGITEFLPVSSSGHLAVADMIAKVGDIETVAMTVVLHAGTLVSVCIVYRDLILDLFKKENWRILWLIFLTLIPTGIIGLAFHYTGLHERLAESPVALGICFCITAALLWFCLKPRAEGDGGTPLKQLSAPRAFIIGTVQGLAILAGISRSGATISTSAGVGLQRSDAAAFSFIISIPAIVGAVGIKMLKPAKAFIQNGSIPGVTGHEVGILTVGFVVSAIAGYVALRWLIAMLRKGQLRYFAIYCFIVGITVLTLGFCGILKHKPHESPDPAAVPSATILPGVNADTTIPVSTVEVPHE